MAIFSFSGDNISLERESDMGAGVGDEIVRVGV